MIGVPRALQKTLDIGTASIKRKSDERYMAQMYEYNNFLDATKNDRAREMENLRFYYGLDDGQYPDFIDIEKMRSEGRHVGTYNLSFRKVNGIAGSITQNPFDVAYIGADPDIDWLTFALQQAYLQDKELMDWTSEDLQATIYGLIYRGWIDMRVETDMPASPIGSIALRSMLPGTVIADPAWKGLSSKTLETVYVVSYMTAEKIKQIYSTKSDDIDREIETNKIFQRGQQFEDNEEIDWIKDYPSTRGDEYLVIEKRYLKKEKVKYDYDPITETVFYDWMPDEEKIRMADLKGIPAERIREIETEEKVYYVQTIVEDFPNLVLEDGKHFIQIGRIPLFPYSATWINGKTMGIIDFLKDAQREVNYRIGTITLGAQNAVNTGIQFDPAVFGNDDSLITDFKQNYGDPRQIVQLKSGSSRAFPEGIKNLPRVPIAQELFQIEREMIDLMDILVPQPAAGEARTERSGESGIHFAQKLQVMKTLQSPLMSGRRQLWNDIGEAYLFLASQLYSMGIREIASSDGKESIILNMPMVNQATGETELANDFSLLASSRMRIQISESPDGVNVRMMQQELNSAIMQSWPRELQNSSMTFADAIQKSLQLTEKQKEDANKALELDRKVIESNSMRVIAENSVAIAQAEQAAMQMQQQAMPQGPGMGGGGAIPPGAGAPISPQGNLTELVGAQVQAPEPAIANPPENYGGV